ncbi:hypothetical protein ACFQV2_09940 [Actinokineospora soli]|uniref:Uncharacterized protein n=1 Tax=Actinokineospora soli TaxID=1048753 RepID=A0ABW2TLX3_9PSEU
MVDTLVDAIARERLGDLDLAPRGLVADDAVAAHALLESLTGDPVLGTPALATERLASALDKWRASAAHDGPVRACFRLHSPRTATTGRSSSCSRPPTTRACWSPRRTCGTAARTCCAAGSPSPRTCCWPSWAARAGSCRASTTRCARPTRPASPSTPRARTSS